MKDIRWFFHRLKAMNIQEVAWRIREKDLQSREKGKYYQDDKPVTEIPLLAEIACLHIDPDRLSINWDNEEWTEFTKLDLFGIYDYDKFKNKWNAGFQTNNTWPEEPFSPTIPLIQRTDIGDIRTNWELNRHYQFAALAKSYYCTQNDKYLIELMELFEDWNIHNRFLHGVEWTSAMELAIRVNSWIYMFCFLKKAACNDKFLSQIEHGILVMADYIFRHRSRFSSANNHLIVEMYAIALTGILTGYAPWIDDAFKELTAELPRQNYADGVNKEMSLHYQSFVMEAYGLLCLIMRKNGLRIPEVWKTYLTAMAEFVADSVDVSGAVIEFGDNDEGKILDLNGEHQDYYRYVLNLMGCILNQKYTDAGWHENLYWILPEKQEIKKKQYTPEWAGCRKEGGYTFFRSKDKKIFIGIDHGALGFGNIAAHGHADALSFQLYVNGQPLILDPGTYFYHCNPETRNAFRSTQNHNTVTVNGKDQSEMLGPFLWGKRAECQLLKFEKSLNGGILVAKHNGYAPIIHKRSFVFNGMEELRITDALSAPCDYMVTFMLAPHMNVKIAANCVFFSSAKCSCKVEFQSEDVFDIFLHNTKISKSYGIQEETQAIRVRSHGRGLTSKITVMGDS